ncbi:Mterfd1, partial [Symbiodinium sp. CCMP2456]
KTAIRLGAGSYNAVVATAARARCWREAVALASELVEQGLRPNVATVASTLCLATLVLCDLLCMST